MGVKGDGARPDRPADGARRDPAPDAHHGGLGVRDQIERYRTAFIAVVTMVVLAAVVGGYILSQENFKLPGWVPVLGRSFFTLKADFQTAQAVTPGQGQAVTIAGAKIGEIASVDLNNGVAEVTMKITPKYALIYHDATALLRPKTTLKDETVEIDPGEPSSGRLKSGETAAACPDGPRRELRRTPRGPRWRHARLPAGAARRGRGWPEGKRQSTRGHAQAL